MQTVEKLHKSYESGEYDAQLIEFYGEENLERQRKRYTDALYFYGGTYGWSRKISMYSVPYSVFLAGDGCDVSIPTDIDALILVADNGTNVSRTRFRSFTGEDNIDTYQYGPYSSEYGIVTGMVRGAEQGFRHFRYRAYGIDMYVDADTLPGIGLDEASHLVMAMGYAYNDIFNKGRLSNKQIADAVQWTLANYLPGDSHATDVYSSIDGKPMLGDFTNAENPTVKPIELDMLGCTMYTVDLGTTDVEIPDGEVDGRLDALIDRLGAQPDEMDEKEFYLKAGEIEDPDRTALLYLMDYYTQENFADIYAENTDEGIGSPTVETTVEPEGVTLGGAIKWHSRVYDPYWMTLCCVKEGVRERFVSSVEKIFGEGTVRKVSVARKPSMRLADGGGKSIQEIVYFVD